MNTQSRCPNKSSNKQPLRTALAKCCSLAYNPHMKKLIPLAGLLFLQTSLASTMNLTVTNECPTDMCWESTTMTFQGTISAKKLSGKSCSATCAQCIPAQGKVLLQITPATSNDMAQISIYNQDTTMSFVTSMGSTAQSYCNRESSNVNTCLFIFNSNNRCSPVGSTSFKWTAGEDGNFGIAAAGK